MDYNKSFLKTISDNYKDIANAFISNQSKDPLRNGTKVDNIHASIANNISQWIDTEKFRVVTKKNDVNSKEYNFDGFYKPKKCDIAILGRNKFENHVFGIIEFKNHLSSIAKNFGNNLNNMIGDSLNIKLNKTPFFYIECYPKVSPILTKEGKVTKNYEITKNDNLFQKSLDLYKNVKIKSEKLNFDSLPDGFLIFVYETPWKFSEGSNYTNSLEKILKYKSDQFYIPENLISKMNEQKEVFVNDYENFLKKINETVEAEYAKISNNDK
ncbi:hypothetical protein [Mesoplasma photuris]|uniref:hypothetical protein n=1 Tax=Mesoplasma photuris TaxID=217731 RepID=UPI0004E15E34|nr:hypothetical protein [Mesoplasma photuris]